ncbi:MAG: signal recognition particle receptor subunit alpha [Nanoarchaeota archaeon]
MLEKLSSVLKKTTDKIANAIFLDKNLVDSIVKDLQRALIEADVNVSLVLEITKKIKQAALDERIKGIEKKEHIIKLLHDELVALLGEKREIKLQKNNTFLLIGLYGNGKTTTISKLASYYFKRGNKVCAISLDIHRPAAQEQLKQLCDKLNIPAFIDTKEKDPKKLWKKYEKELKNYNLIIIDTAGRDALSSDLIKEIKNISKFTKPTETFLVMSADVGQTAKKQAQAFKEACSITGVIITKMDSTAKAGGALTACAEVKAPVIFIGTGEKPQDLETFDPESFLSRLLGMGDLKSLIEKIHSVINKDKIEEQQKRLQEGKFTLRDLQAQLESMESMGSMDKLLGMIPGLGKVKDKISSNQLETQQEKVKRWKHAINSMTKEEIENPEILEKQTSRLQRIAKGSGTATSDIRALIKQYKMLKEIISSQSSLKEIGSGSLDQKTMMKLAKKFAKKIKF